MQPGWRFAAVHAALAVAVWLFGVVVYAQWCGEPRSPWLAFDIALIVLIVVALRRQPLRWWMLAGVVVLATACILGSQLYQEHTLGIYVDESNYLATLREGRIVRNGMAPFIMRWLTPFLAGAWNVTPLIDTAALSAVNFGALVVTTSYLVLLLARLGVRWPVAAAAPVFFACSYLGGYAAANRLLVDPLSYAFSMIVFHLLVRREHERYLALLLLIASFNSEKAVYWVPVIALVALLRGETWRRSAVAAVRAGAPAVLYLAAIAFYVRASERHPTPLFLQNLRAMAFTPFGELATDPVVHENAFRTLWFPFGAFTIFTLLSLRIVERWLLAITLLLVPFYGLTLIAYDTQRMLAYAFIVYLPLGSLYLSRVLTGWWHALLVLLAALAIVQYYTPLGGLYPELLSLIELAVVAVLVLLSRRGPSPPPSHAHV